MNWIYSNNTNAPVFYRSKVWLPDQSRETAFPVPPSLGLTCIQEGDSPDPVLLHTDIIIPPGGQEVISINHPKLSNKVDVNILCLSPDSGCECRFNSPRNCVIPIDYRGFQHITSWENCFRIFLHNSTDHEAHISVSVFEAVN